MPANTDLSPAADKPPHVPDAMVYDFDIHADPAYRADPFNRLLELIEKAPPVFWTPRNGGHWIFMGYAANFDAARDTNTFSNELIPKELLAAMLPSMPPGTQRVPQPIPVNLDAPDHAKYRIPLQHVFSPKAVQLLEGQIRALAIQLIDNVAGCGQCEFISEIAEPMAVQIFLRMMGLPVDRHTEYRALIREMLSNYVYDVEQNFKTLVRIVEIMRDTVLERRKTPQDDVISRLWTIEIDGGPVTLEEMEDYCLMLFIAGLDTVMNGMGHGMRHLAQDMQLQEKLRANPALLPDVTEELLRRYSFVAPLRRVTKDTGFEGALLLANEYVTLLLPAANLDPAVFHNAGIFNVRRENKTHIAFNAGPHRCIGSHLARIELSVLYEQMLGRLPTFRLDPTRFPKYRCGHTIGVESLHLVWA